MRPPIPLDGVTKGRPLMGTYCPKHASMYMQLEMLQQQILADKHGLEFKSFKPRMPKMLKSGPIKTLSKEDVMSPYISRMVYNPTRIRRFKDGNR